MSTRADCAVAGCPRPVAPGGARGWCRRHYRRWRAHGDPRIVRHRRDPAAAFWAKVDRGGAVPPGAPELGGCWVWTAATRGGYGAFHLPAVHPRPARAVAAHQWAYEHHLGPVPPGQQVVQLCHLADALTVGCGGGPTCAHRLCVNPTHLAVAPDDVPLTGAVALRGGQTRCARGHRFDRVDQRGQRRCSRCVREHAVAVLPDLVRAADQPHVALQQQTLTRLIATTRAASSTDRTTAPAAATQGHHYA